MTTPTNHLGTNQMDAFVQDTAADVFYREIESGTRKLLEPDLRKIIDLDEKIYVRDSVLADLKARLEKNEAPKGFMVPRIPQVPASVKAEFTATFDDLVTSFITDVTSALIKSRESDRTKSLEDLVIARTAYKEKFVTFGEEACTKMGITVSDPALLRSRLQESAATTMYEERQKAKLKKVFDKLGKEKAEAETVAQEAIEPTPMQQDDEVSLLKKQVAVLEKKVNTVVKESKKGASTSNTTPKDPKTRTDPKPGKSAQKTKSKMDKKAPNGNNPPKKGKKGGSGKGKGAARGAK